MDASHGTNPKHARSTTGITPALKLPKIPAPIVEQVRILKYSGQSVIKVMDYHRKSLQRIGTENYDYVRNLTLGAFRTGDAYVALHQGTVIGFRTFGFAEDSYQILRKVHGFNFYCRERVAARDELNPFVNLSENQLLSCALSFNLVVLPGYNRLGIAQRIILASDAAVAKRGCHAFFVNALQDSGALGTYSKCGYTDIGFHPDAFVKGVGLNYMVKLLKPPQSPAA